MVSLVTPLLLKRLLARSWMHLLCKMTSTGTLRTGGAHRMFLLWGLVMKLFDLGPNDSVCSLHWTREGSAAVSVSILSHNTFLPQVDFSSTNSLCLHTVEN
ncbi:uncharacterized protein LOC108822104 isoform X2 [Raphanus sativus]|uniref:Uncharacterized protein LOC108822104 isoform X2 n=1 Tax=Raphanus sativus TaxID=3726 RepID=A0A9W3CAG1_RAPSA|nr:uncharacterized protein LOC108822104 isoform X2 [Raphanus sativus]